MSSIAIPNSALYGASLGLISFISIPSAIFIRILATKAPLHPSPWRPPLQIWLLAHQLQNILALTNLIELPLLLASFPLVSAARSKICTTHLPIASCRALSNAWDSVVILLAVAGVISILICFCLYCSVMKRRRRSRTHRILRNRPWALAIAHFHLQISAGMILTAAFSDLFVADTRSALVASMVLETLAVFVFFLGAMGTLYGVVRYHVAMKGLRREAYVMELEYAEMVGWGRGFEEGMCWCPVKTGRRVGRRMERELDEMLDALATRMTYS
ncbi:MAG: hypothetical protein Q9208_003443 [Pyrenodesmia sp. 3 TL-2023]